MASRKVERKPRFLYYRNETPAFISDRTVVSSLGDKLSYIVLDDEQVIGNLKTYIVRDGVLMEKAQIPWKRLRVAMITDYGVNCGIATYSRYLCDEIRQLVGELRIFAEHAAVEDKPEDNVVRCWTRTKDYSQIAVEMEKFNPDIIFIQHEFGLFHRIDKWNALISQLSRWRVIATLHTVLEHDVENEEARLDYTTRALSEAACREVIVHTPRARQTLRNRGFSGDIHYVPHGCFPPSTEPKLPATKYGMFTEYSLFQYGFGGHHKGWEKAIEVVARLKPKYPDLFYIGVFNVTSNSHDGAYDYYRKLLDTVREKGLEQNVAILRGYQSETMLRNYLRSVRVALFLYQVPNKHWCSWGASGAIQLPLSLGIPMVLSDFPAFLEFESKLPISYTVEHAVETVDRIFSDKAYEKQMAETSLSISEARSWNKVAAWYLSCVQGTDYDAPP